MDYGIYIHIPFCRQNCKYCHFVTTPPDNSIIYEYQAAVIQEIALFVESQTEPIDVNSIYFGGGTPSLIQPEYIGAILEMCRTSFSISGNCEISLEANPDTIRINNLKSYVDSGINRISIGAQSFSDRELKAIGRTHTSDVIEASVKMLSSEGISNINLDLLMGLPFQTARSWRKSLDRIAALDVSHISVYMLDLDLHCSLSEAVASGLIPIPSDDAVADSYLDTLDTLDSYGYKQYEISNFSRPGYSCRHNLKYWQREPVIGFGLASHSFDGRSRYANVSSINSYMQSLKSGRLPVEWREPINKDKALEETLFLGLRLKKGIQWLHLHHDYPVERLVEYEKSLRDKRIDGLVEWNDSTVRLTPSGMLLSNEIFQLFV